MAQNVTNHAGKEHRPSPQFARIRGESRIRWIHDDEDWARMHRPGEGIKLLCPDKGCGHVMESRQMEKTETRFLAAQRGQHCSHRSPKGGGGRMTAEHLWLQGKVHQICARLGYTSGLEVDYADVRVESDPPIALEVQRVSTNFKEREAQRRERGMQTIWLLPETGKQKDTKKPAGGEPLFRIPAVRVWYYEHTRSGLQRISGAALFGSARFARSSDDIEVKVGATLWEPAADGVTFQRAKTMTLESFLQQVLGGERRWYSKEEIHGASSGAKGVWAGWVRPMQLEEVRAGRERQERQHRQARADEKTDQEDMRRRLEQIKMAALQSSAIEIEPPFDPSDGDESQAPQTGKEPAKSTPLAPPAQTISAEVRHDERVEPPAAKPWWKRLWAMLLG